MRLVFPSNHQTPMEKPFVIHYACRLDDGSLRPFTCWIRVQMFCGIRLIVYQAPRDYYCPTCQFAYRGPGCLLATDGASLVEDDVFSHGRGDYYDGRTCAICHARISDRATYCNQCAKIVVRQRRQEAMRENAAL